MLRKGTDGAVVAQGSVLSQGGLFGESKEVDLEAHYKKEILKTSGSFETAEALAKLYASQGKIRELNEFIASVIEVRHFKANLAAFADLACKIGILYEHLPEEASLQYINTWSWYGAVITSYRENVSDTQKPFGEACFRMAKMIKENKGFKFKGLEHVVKNRFEMAFEAGVVGAAYELGDFHLKNFFEGNIFEAVAWFEKGKAAGDKRCEIGLEEANSLLHEKRVEEKAKAACN